MKRLLMAGTMLFVAISSGEAAMAKKIDKEALANKIKALAGLDADERSELLGLLSEQKKYGLVWEDKPEDVEAVLREQLPVLTEVKERAIVAPDAPNHILIEGDNLHALTCLTYTHSNKIDVIYIDPPYNTGNDFIYNDNYVGKDDAYRHSKWLSFMSKRIKIAKQLLSERGLIFIQIDDNEHAPLKLLCDQILGEEMFLTTIAWEKRTKCQNTKTARKMLQLKIEYILVYKNKNSRVEFNCHVIGEHDYPEADGKGEFRIEEVGQMGITGVRGRGSMVFPILGIMPRVGNQWKIGKDTVNEFLDRGDLFENSGKVYRRIRPDDEASDKIKPFWAFFPAEQFGTAESAKNELSQILGRKDHGFETVKPSQMLSEIIFQATKSDSIVLDFFAGSGTTLQATLEVNAEYGGKRTCILVTNNENGICEKVTYERNRRVIQGYTNAKGEAVPGLTENSLRYYKTEFVPRRPSPRNARALMAASVDLLCVKNDLYEEVPRFFGKKLKKSAGRYFDDGHGKRMLVLFDETTVPSVAAAIRDASFKGKVKIYVFAHGDYAYNEEFEEVADNVELCALPAAIRNAYRRVIGKYRPQEDAQ